VVLMRSLVDPITDRHLWTFRKIERALGWYHEYAKAQHDKAIHCLLSAIGVICNWHFRQDNAILLL